MELNTSLLLAIGSQGLFYLLLFVFVIQTVMLAYHWFAYGASKQVSLLALAVYLGGGAVLFLTLSFTLTTL